MKMNKEKFLKTELGSNMRECVKAWDHALEEQWIHDYSSEEYKRGMQSALWCQAQWEVYQMALRQFYGIKCYFMRNDEYFGICIEDEMDWLFRINRIK